MIRSHWMRREMLKAGAAAMALGQVKDRYYAPGLLAKLTCHKAEPLRKID